MDFPSWYQPRRDVGAILVTSQIELDALIESGWPDVQCPDPNAPAIEQPVEVKQGRKAKSEN